MTSVIILNFAQYIMDANMRTALVAGIFLSTSPLILGQATEVDAQVKSARLLQSVKSGRPNSTGDMKAPQGSAFLWIMIRITRAETVPLVLDLDKVTARNSSGKFYPPFGVQANSEESPVVATAFRPVNTGGGQAWVETSAQSKGNGFEFAVDNPVPQEELAATKLLD